MKIYENYIFDFDGVLVDSKELTFKAINYALEKIKLPTISEYDFNTKSKSELITERNVGYFKSIVVLFLARRYMKLNYQEMKPIKELITKVSKCKKNKVIVSSNTKKNIILALGPDNKLFSKIIGSVGNGKKSKFLKPYAGDSLYITDEVRDIIECQKINMDVLAVTWGLDSEEKLKSHRPTQIIYSPKDLNLK